MKTKAASLFGPGILSVGIYTAILLFYGTPMYPTGHWNNSVLAGISVAVLAAAYLWGVSRLFRLEPGRDVLRAIIGFAVIFALIATLTMPFHSTDVFVYIGMGWFQAHFGANPYSQVFHDRADALADPMITNEWMDRNTNAWRDFPFVYGFLFALASRALAWIGGGNWPLTLFLFKLLNLAAYATTAWIVWVAAKALGHPKPQMALYLFTWSPLVLIHHLANAHNDILVGALVALAVYLVISRREFWAMPLLILATLIKYLALFLLPFILAVLIKRKKWRTGFASLFVAIGIAGVLALPYAGDLNDFNADLMRSQMTKMTGSLQAGLYYSYRAVTGILTFLKPTLESFGFWMSIVAWIGASVFLIREGSRRLNDTAASAQELVVFAAILLTVILVVASSQFYAWYLGMVFPILLLVPDDRWLWRTAVIGSVLHLLSLTPLLRKGIGYAALTTVLAILWSTFHPPKSWNVTAD